MDHRPPPPRPPLRSATSNSAFSRISTVSDFTDLDSFQADLSDTPASQSRPALASLHTSSTGHEGYSYASPTSTWVSFSHNIGYSPVASTDAPPPHNPARGYTQRRHEAIPEEDSSDIGLVQSAAPMSGRETHGSSAPPVSAGPVFDFTNTLGPTTQADEAFLKALQEQEAQGKLTGGLGAGIRTDMTVTESALLAASPVSERPMSRTFSRGGRRDSRSETVKRLGQSEANKRGEVIEVVMDDHAADVTPHSKVDISLVAGHDDGDDPTPFVMKQTTFPTRQPTTALFYPQPNWKPFSMQWLYLLVLIVLSLGLGAAVEVLYRLSARTPLVTFQTPSDIPTAEYFAVKFLPMIVAVSYGVLWQITNFDVMRLEPFYQLSKEGGALAAESFNVDYLTQFNLFRPFWALRYRHYAVAVSAIASLLANTLVPTLGAASIVLSPDRDTRLHFPDVTKTILFDHVWSRLLTATFAVIAFLGCILFYLLQTRRSGLVADVKGIAGVASMATASHILMDFKDMDVASHQDIHHKLKSRRYVLRNSSLAPADDYSSSSSSTTWSPSTTPQPPNTPHQHNHHTHTHYTKNHLSANPQPLMLRPLGALPFLLALLAFTALLPLALFQPAVSNALTDRAPWLLTAFAVVLKLSWAALETDVRLMEPYFVLAGRRAPASALALDYTGAPFGWVAVKGVVNGHWVVVVVGVGTVVAEVLTVLVTSLATVEGRVFVALSGDNNNGDDGGGAGAEVATGQEQQKLNAGQETVPSFWVSLALALVILVYMAVTAGVVFLRRRRVCMPRQPNTIASVLAYIHQSKMLYDFVGTAKLSNAEMVRRLEGLGKTYGLGWFRGRDGQTHCGVDEEELLSGYKVGYDYSRATKPWEETEVNWL